MRNRGLVGRRVVTTALAISLAAGFLAVGAAVVTASAQPSVTCTFNGKPGPVSITGVVPGTSTVSISCTGTSGLSLATAQASPLGGFVIPPATATGEADIATLTPLKESPPGTYTATFAVPANFSASDPNAVCPPSPGQFNAGLVGCAIAVIDTSDLSPLPGQEAVLVYSTQTTPPNAPTLATSSSTVTEGEHITFSDATGACPDNPTSSSQCWWGNGLEASSSSANPPTVTISLDGSPVPGASATIQGPGAGGTPTYNGTTLTPQALSGSLTLPSPLSDGNHTLTVSETNVTPFNGNGTNPAPGSPIVASTTLVVGPFSGPTVTSVSPPSGSSAGGTSVSISGSEFTGATAIDFGSTPAASFVVNSASSITAVSPKGDGSVDVTVTTPLGTSLLSNADRFTYTSPTAPVVTGLSPSSGTQVGGTLVAVNGSGFSGASAIHFGSNAATSINVISDSEVVAASPSGSGIVDVTVTTALGTSKTTTADRYSYLPGSAPAPTVTSVAPNFGGGGSVVQITGTGFSGATSVSFGPSASPSVTVISDSSISAIAPPGPVTGSPVDVTVTTPAGTSATSSSDQFLYVAAPAVSAVTPNTGSPAGGYQVDISGSGFTGASSVKFGSSPSPNFTVNSDSDITATVPAGTGTVDVTVTTTGGTSAVTPSDEFTYGAPAVTSVSPSSGSPLGGYTVTVDGTGFTGTTAVDFGTVPATNLLVSSDTSLSVTVPAGTGTVDVTVTTPVGTSAVSPSDQFTYVAVPSVTSLSPNEGPTGGGNSVVVAGTSLTGATEVDFGTTPGTNLVVTSDTSLDVTVPAGAGTVDVTVTVPGGTSPTNSSDQYTYVAAPEVTKVNPNTGPASGGTTVKIKGSGFSSATEVDFGSGNPTSFTVNSDTSITAVSPGSSAGAGPVHVIVLNPGGTSATTSADIFTYLVLPSVTSVSPAAGPPSGGTQVDITGTGFTASSTVAFGAVKATKVNVVSPTTILVTSPTGTGTVDLTVTTAKGTSLTSSADQFTYERVPTVSSISPADGPLSGNVSVTVTGTNFTAATQVKFGSAASASITVTSPTTIVAIAPSAADPATVDVTVTTPSGRSATSSADQFTYLAIPVVTSLSPNQGPVSGGTSVTIAGSGFATATSVTFAGVSATGFTVESDTDIIAVAPAQTNPAPFGATVQVTTSGGTAGNGSAADTFTYTAVVPTVTGVSPNSNTSTGGSLVTITGTGFTSDASVNFGSTPAGGGIGVSVISPTEIQAGSPGGSPGTVDITVTTSGGTSAINAADQFTYLLEKATITVTPNTGASPGSSVTVTGSGFPTGTGSLIGSGGVVLVEASPLGALVSGFSAIEEIDLNQFQFQPVDNNGNFTTQFTVPSPFMALGDPNAACAPLQNQVDVGLVGCAVAALYESSAGVSLGGVGIADVSSPIIFNDTQPDPPTLSVPSTTIHAGDTINFTGSGWWGSYPGGGATAKICGIAGNPSNCDATTGSGVVTPTTYSGVGGTLGGATLTGSITVGSDLADCTSCFLTVTQPNLTPIPGNVTSSVALTILPPAPTVTAVSPNKGSPKGGIDVTITGTGFAGASSVSFGGEAAGFTFVSSTEISAVVPPHAVGTVDVTVTTPSGTSATSAQDAFTYKKRN